MTLDDFTDDIASRSRWARKHNQGHPSPAWSTGEQLAVALVLKDRTHLGAMGYTVQQAAQHVYDGMTMPPAGFGAWLESLRGRLDTGPVTCVSEED
jgi:hypothetical protein